MPALPAPRRKHLAAAWTLHARPEAVRLGAAAFARLIGALWQSNPPLWLRTAARADFTAAHFSMQRKTGQQPCAFAGQTFLSVRLGFSGGYTGASAALRELFSVSNPAHRVKKRGGHKLGVSNSKQSIRS